VLSNLHSHFLGFVEKWWLTLYLFCPIVHLSFLITFLCVKPLVRGFLVIFGLHVLKLKSNVEAKAFE
jgi:hypothetical protein